MASAVDADARPRSAAGAILERLRGASLVALLSRRALLVYGALAAIIGVATLIRTWDIVNNPPGFFADEASLGYNAWSILHTGKDEHGVRMPLFFEAFGEYKLAFFVYAQVPFIALLGMTELAVRLPSALLGVATVVALYLLARELTRDEPLALVSAAVLAVLPWHVHYTRTGFGNISAHVLFLVLGLYFFLVGTRRPWFWPVSAAVFGVGLYSYRAAWVLLPPLLGILALVYWRELLARWRIVALSLVILGMMGIPILVHTFAVSGDRTQDQWIFALDLGAWDTITRFASQYRDHFTNAFLFDGRAEGNLRHVLPDEGWVYLWQIPFLAIGGMALLWRPTKAKIVILGCLAIFPLAAALSVSGPSSNRAMFGAPVFALITALGLTVAARLAHDWSAHYGGRAVGLGLAGVLVAGASVFAVLQTRSYIEAYHGRYQEAAAGFNGWQWGAGPVIDYFVSVENEYDELVMGGDFNAANIFLPFYAPDDCRNCFLGRWDKYDDERHQLFALSPPNLARVLDYEVRDLLYNPGNRLAFAMVEATGHRFSMPGNLPQMIVGTPSASLDELDGAIEANPNDAGALADRGLLHLSEGRYEAAMSDLDQAIAKGGDGAALRVNRGYARWHTADFGHAMSDYLTAVELDPTLVEAHYNRGTAYSVLGDVGRAARDLGQAQELDPELAAAPNNLGNLFLQVGDLDRALPRLQQAIELDPELAPAYASRGLVRWLASDDALGGDEALDDFDRAIELDPELAVAYVYRGEVIMALGSASLAIPDFDRAIELSLDSGAGYSGRGFAYAVTGDYARAAADLDRAIDLDRDDAVALLRRAVVHMRQGDANVAIRTLRDALDLDRAVVRTSKQWRPPTWSLAGRALELRELEEAALSVDDAETREQLQEMARYLRRRA